MKLLIYIPAYNEERSISKVIASLPKKTDGVDSVECVVVNDGSSDKTAEQAAKAGAFVITHHRNLGVGAAFHTAVTHALRTGADILVSIDADGQFDPADIPSLIHPILFKEAEMCVGNRFWQNSKPKHMPSLKYYGNKMMNKLIGRFCSCDVSDASCGFRAYSREALLALNLHGRFTYTQETILNLSFKGLRISFVPVKVTYFPDRTSRVASSVTSYAFRTLKIILRTFMDYKPFHFFGWIGLIVFCAGLVCDAALVIHYISTGSLSPYKFLGFIGAGFNFLGLFILSLGLVADMLLRLRLNIEKILYYEKERSLSR